mgnify:CR=1 FL=1|jgi:hypothetical protein
MLSIREITFSYLDGLNEEGNFDIGIEAVRKELFPNNTPDEFVKKYASLLKNKDSMKNGRGADIFALYWEEKIVGMSINHYYDWQLLSPQRCFRLTIEGNSCEITPSSFGDLVGDSPKINSVAEIAAIWVSPEFRGRKYGEKLFSHSLQVIQKQLQGQGVIFLAVRGVGSRDEGNRLFESLSGDKKSVFLSPSSLSICSEEITEKLALSPSIFHTHKESQAVISLSSKNHFRHSGFFLACSSIWLKVLKKEIS